MGGGERSGGGGLRAGLETAGEGVGLVGHDADPVVFLGLGGHCGGVEFGEGAGEEAEEAGFYEHWRGRGEVFWCFGGGGS